LPRYSDCAMQGVVLQQEMCVAGRHMAARRRCPTLRVVYRDRLRAL